MRPNRWRSSGLRWRTGAPAAPDATARHRATCTRRAYKTPSSSGAKRPPRRASPGAPGYSCENYASRAAPCRDLPPLMSYSLEPLVAQLSTVILGKETAIRQSLACLLAGGHLLIEDLPGVGKTTLAHALAIGVGLRFSR